MVPGTANARWRANIGEIQVNSINQADFFEIQRVVEDWVIFRDAGMFDRLAALWHEDGRMMTTWSQVTGEEAVAPGHGKWDSGQPRPRRLPY
jgi:hypothetical protein